MTSANNTTGLTNEQATESRRQHGGNTLEMQEDRMLLLVLKEVALEPMFILLMSPVSFILS